MLFYPAEATVPTDLRTHDLQLRVLRPEHTELDYDAFMSSRARMLLWSGGGWPDADFTVARNLVGLQKHEQAFNARTQFTYTVLNHEETLCEGCVYVDTWDTSLRGTNTTPASLGVGDFEGVTSFWVRDSALTRDLDRQLLDGLVGWFASPAWSFTRIVFRANQSQVRDIEILEDAGLQRLHAVETADERRTVYFYGT